MTTPRRPRYSAITKKGYEDTASSFIEFRPTPHTRHGFALAQLLHYTLEPDPELPPDATPREGGDLDVVFGLRLDALADLLREHKLVSRSAL